MIGNLGEVSEQGHLKRLHQTWQRQPTYFIATCVAKRRALLATESVHLALREEWHGLHERHGWAVGRYVLMPDHVHFFMTPLLGDAKPLATTVGKWKEWTAKRVLPLIGASSPLRQPEFFDHILRSDESRSEKWTFVWSNPVRAGLVARAEDWPFAGSIHFE